MSNRTRALLYLVLMAVGVMLIRMADHFAGDMAEGLLFGSFGYMGIRYLQEG